MYSRPWSSSVYDKEARIRNQFAAREDALYRERNKILSRSTEPTFSASNLTSPDPSVASISSISETSAPAPIFCRPSSSEVPGPAPILCQPVLCKASESGKRDLKEIGIEYSVNKDCQCGKSCLTKLKTSNNTF